MLNIFLLQDGRTRTVIIKSKENQISTAQTQGQTAGAYELLDSAQLCHSPHSPGQRHPMPAAVLSGVHGYSNLQNTGVSCFSQPALPPIASPGL